MTHRRTVFKKDKMNNRKHQIAGSQCESTTLEIGKASTFFIGHLYVCFTDFLSPVRNEAYYHFSSYLLKIHFTDTEIWDSM